MEERKGQIFIGCGMKDGTAGAVKSHDCTLCPRASVGFSAETWSLRITWSFEKKMWWGFGGGIAIIFFSFTLFFAHVCEAPLAETGF